MKASNSGDHVNIIGGEAVGKFLAAGLAVALLGACAGKPTLYEWNGYQAQLLNQYQNPEDTRAFADALVSDIEAAEAQDKVPPGLYAEYGFVLLQLGDSGTAIEWFAKERDAWPESAFLMNKIIARLSMPATPATDLPDADKTGDVVPGDRR